jgi:RimJ/RimL family protein N-acetyltransferase
VSPAWKWPLFDLAVTTPRLTLRYATDDDLQTLAGFRSGRVLRAGQEPFDGDSSFYAEGDGALRRALVGEWGARGRTSPEWWHLSFAAVTDGEVIGQQNITAADFPTLRTVNSFSFLELDRQGQGLGKEMRRAVLHLAFDGLGALRAESDAFADNTSSIGVSLSLGYRDNGTMLAPRPSGPALMLRFVMTGEEWGRVPHDDITIRGLDGALPVLGLQPSHD